MQDEGGREGRSATRDEEGGARVEPVAESLGASLVVAVQLRAEERERERDASLFSRDRPFSFSRVSLALVLVSYGFERLGISHTQPALRTCAKADE